MKKPVQRYMAIFCKGSERAQMQLEAKSDRGAARIAAGYQFKDVGYLTPRLDLESLLRYESGLWCGYRHLDELVENVTQCVRRAA